MKPTPVSNRFEALEKDATKMADDMSSAGTMDIPIEALIRDSTARQKRRIKEHMKKRAKQFRKSVEGCMCSGHDGVDGSVGEFPPLVITSLQSEAAERERERERNKNPREVPL